MMPPSFVIMGIS